MTNEQQGKIDIFALTDCHQEARKLCNLFSGVIRRAPNAGQEVLVCDCGDLFKGIYDRELCVENYLRLRRKLPRAEIVLAIGNNDFGFNSENMKFLQDTSKRFKQAGIRVLCANLEDLATGKCPSWVDPYVVLNIGGKKILITAFCVNYVRLQKYNLRLNDITETFSKSVATFKQLAPDALIILNHALRNSSEALWHIAQEQDLRADLIIGGHEHSPVEPNPQQHIYYPQAFSRNMLHFEMTFAKRTVITECIENISSKTETADAIFEPLLAEYENKVGLNVPIAKSTLNLERSYSDFCSLGSFVADQMRLSAHADIAMLSTGYLTHALRYESGKILTVYNLERVFSAQTPIQTIVMSPKTLKAVFNNSIRFRYLQSFGNTRFVQCSGNIKLVCAKNKENFGEVRQIYINNEPLLDEEGNPLHPEDEYLCALDPFIGAGELGYEMLRALPKETLMKNNQLVRIKDLIVRAVKEAEHKYPQGADYPCATLSDI